MSNHSHKISPVKEKHSTAMSPNPGARDSESPTSPRAQSRQLTDAPLYHPLQKNSRQIRVAILLPGPWREVVRCELKVVDLSDESTQYEAISYCWGDEKVTTPIIIDEREVPVTVNLNDALKRLRKRDQGRTVWADAICINQEDTVERQHQVEMMRDIYSHATTVHVFMGESSASKLALEHFDTKNWDEFPVIRWYNDDRNLPGLESPPGECLTIEDTLMAEMRCFLVLTMLAKHGCLKQVYKTLKTTPHTSAWAVVLDAFKELFESPWWSRIWVVQEVLLAKEALVHFGHTVFPWGMLKNASLKTMWHHGIGCCDYYLPSEYIPAITIYTIPGNLWLTLLSMAELKKPAGTLGLQLSHLLAMSKSRDATDRLDKIYGVLGLLPHNWWESKGVDPIVPDYTRDVVSVFTEACLKAIETSGSLEILTRNVPGKVTEGLPSWVPDWCYDGVWGGSHKTTSGFTLNESPLGYSKAVVSVEETKSDLPTGKKLRIRGVPIGVIASGQIVRLPEIKWSGENPRIEMSSSTASRIARSVDDCRRISQLPVRPSDRPEQDPTLSPREVKFWTTLLKDKYSKRELLERHLAYQSWVRGDNDSPGFDISVGINSSTETTRGGDESIVEHLETTNHGFDVDTFTWRYPCARTFLRLDSGSLGITTADCLPGDQVYWFPGGWFPFILRERPRIEQSLGEGPEKSDGGGLQEFELLGPCDVPDLLERRVWEEETHDVLLV
ncbi:Heterokaryon incompatibility protein (HET) domain containing protein [Naviculisporaceae sp. PSN 640]